ncbi:MAG: hypothetical protein AB1486_00800 [Planctomycetota bacterium]
MRTRILVVVLLAGLAVLVAWRLVVAYRGGGPGAISRTEPASGVSEPIPSGGAIDRDLLPGPEADPTAWSLFGQVRYQDGPPLEGALVAIDRLTAAQPVDEITDHTDAEGGYEIGMGPYEVGSARVEAEGCAIFFDGSALPQRSQALESGGRARWDVEVPRACTVAGRVLDARTLAPVEGQPLRVTHSNDTVRYDGEGRASHSTTREVSSERAQSDAQGFFQIPILAEGAGTLSLGVKLGEGCAQADLRAATLTREGVPDSLSARGVFKPLPRAGSETVEKWPLQPHSPVDLIAGQRVDTGTHLVGPMGRLLIRLIDHESGDPVADRWVITGCPVRGVELVSEPTDRAGETVLEYPPSRRLARFEVQGVLRFPLEGEIDVPPAGMGSVTLELPTTEQERPAVTFRISRPDNAPIAGAKVMWGDRIAESDEGGEARFLVEWSSRADLLVTHEEYQTEMRRDFNGSAGDSFNIVLQPRATVLLRLTSPSGALVRSAFIGYMRDGRHLGNPRASHAEDGCHAVAPVAQDTRVFVKAEADGFATVLLTPSLAPGSTVDVRLEAVEIVQGIVFAPTGASLPGVRVVSMVPEVPCDVVEHGGESPDVVSYWHVQQEKWAIGGTTTGADGSFRLLVPTHGGVVCCVAADGAGLLVRDASAAALQRLIMPRPHGVTFVRGAPQEGDWVLAVSRRDEAVLFGKSLRWEAASTQVETTFPLEGEYEVQVFGPEFELLSETSLSVRGDQTTIAVR